MLRRQGDEADVPCTALMADAMLRGLLMGTLWGAVTDLDIAERLVNPASHGSQIESVHRSLHLRRARVVFRSAGTFGLFISLYSGGSCAAERITGHARDHWIPATVGGFFSGTVFALRTGNVSSYMSIVIGATTAVFAGFARYVQDS